ncbi:MAG: LemA family protein [Spirochaetes bacterium]|uniref:LemA family protein n=1 Tax=Candidatus Ornithospirochaeta stercoripullorum TaxID=2840899 RepID=A0A9D9E1K5_9SPIO|nr:LemA family protein [Candidatus Ornithospirochaeta stercoripullorum]
MIVLIIVVLFVAIILLWAVTSYNSLVKLRNKGDEAEAGIDAHLKERADLIPNLVETIKGYASHEKEALESVVSARSKASSLQGDERMRAEGELSTALGRLFAIAESYPELKANQNFIALQGELTRLEATLANARKYYNAIVREYNDKIMVFPSSLIASLFHFGKRNYIEIDAGDRERVDVRF